jgi:hypothetical protein
MIDGLDLRSLGTKAIADEVDAYTVIETLEGSLPMTLRVLNLWIHPSGVTANDMIASASRIGNGVHHHARGPILKITAGNHHELAIQRIFH